MLAVLFALAGHGPVKPVVPAAPMQYRIDAKSHQEVDLTAFGQPSQTTDLNARIFISLTMMDTTGGKLAHVVIDSMSFDATGQMQMAYNQAAADSAKGTFMHAYIVGGKVKDNAVLQVENAATSLARQTLSLLFAGTRAGMKSGDGWTDTTASTNKGANGTTTTQVVTGWKVTAADGEMITAEGTGNGKSSVEGGPQGQTIAGTSTSKSTVTAPPGGPSRSATLTSQQALQVTIPGAPEPIPVTATSNLTLTRLN
jgi:hypothetical protein